MANHKTTHLSGSGSKAATSAPDAIAHLERVAQEHEKIASVVRQLAKGLASVTGWTQTPPLPQAKKRKGKRRPMSAAVKKRLSEAAKKRWAEKRAEEKELGVRK